MRLLHLAAGASLLLGTAFGTAVEAQRPAAPAVDWLQRVEQTADGGYRVGNPDARVKVVEFVSLTCPHCRDFAATGGRQLAQNYVSTGRVSFEIRPYPLDIIAATGAQLSACAAPAQAVALHDAILAAQDSVFSRVEALSAADVQAVEQLAPAEQRVRIAEVTGMTQIAAQHGLDASSAARCLMDDAGAQRIGQAKAAAERIGIDGTPSFTINGIVARQVHDWTALEPLLRQP